MYTFMSFLWFHEKESYLANEILNFTIDCHLLRGSQTEMQRWSDLKEKSNI